MRHAVFVLLLASLASHGHAADAIQQQQLTLEGAKRAVAAAVAHTRDRNAPGGAIAVVDNGGHLVYLERLDGTFAAGATISIGKARTAVMFKRPTKGLEDIINKGRTAMIPVAEVAWFTPLQGGVPLSVGGEIVGGIGVSGAASAQQDEEIAMAGAQALASPASAGTPAPTSADPVQHIDQVQHIADRDVRAAFGAGETGGTLVATSRYRVNASRRDGPGLAEIHANEADIFYVLEGTATFVTGGDLLEGKRMGGGEVRGTALRGGTERELAPGDVITVPAGVPHWFRRVSTPFIYYVVKSASPG